MIQYWIRRISHPLKGLLYAFRHDSAFQIEFLFGMVFLVTIHFVFGPFKPEEQLLLLFTWFFIMVTELQNTAVETALDKLHPERDKKVGLSKDLTAAAVVWAGVFGLISLYYVLSGKL